MVTSTDSDIASWDAEQAQLKAKYDSYSLHIQRGIDEFHKFYIISKEYHTLKNLKKYLLLLEKVII